MKRPFVRSAGLAILLTVNGCGLVSSGSDNRASGLAVAEAALQSGSGQIALQVSEGVLRQSPGNVQALEIKGDALTLLGDYEQASAIFQALVALDPTAVRPNIGLGRAKLTKEPAVAEVLFQNVLKKEPANLTALNNVGIARDLQGRHADAQSAYRVALAASPDLDSAQVNLALSMSMSGNRKEAIQLLKAKATQPGAAVKIRQDYAVVLAMAGNRVEAEHVLADSLSPDEARQMLDAATGTHTKTVAEREPTRLATNDGVEPDVVQVPEVPTPTQSASRTAQSHGPVISAIAATAAPPIVVRPVQSAADQGASPAAPPNTPVAAAMTYQRPLALPLRAEDADQTAIEPRTDNVVSMPAQIVAPAPARKASLAPALPPEAERVETVSMPPKLALANPAPVGTSAVPAAPAPAFKVAIAVPPATPAPVAKPDATAGRSRISTSVTNAPTVQFAATGSEESAHSVWQSLVRKYPELLGDREVSVNRGMRGHKIFWQVRTDGFESMSDARAFCAEMRNAGQQCFLPRT